jgi:glycosyltransferase involved in cell wall biosynthesis
LWHADLFGIPAARLAGVKTVISSRHNDDAFRHKSVIRLVNRVLWRMVSAGIAISEAIARFSVEVENAPPAKIHVVRYGLQHNPNTVNPSAARKALREELNLDDDALLVGMVCRLTQQKGVIYGLQAFAQSALQFPTAHLVIAGDGPLREALQEETRALKLEDKVHFLGWRDESAQVMAALDVFLVPSLWEGFGLVILEAMVHQIPVIGSRVSAIPEVVADKETGLLVPPRDVDGLVNAMNMLLADKSLRRYMGLLGEDRLETHFSAERMAEETAAIYRKFANTP